MNRQTTNDITVLLVEDNLGDAILIKEILAEASTALLSSAAFQIIHVERLQDALTTIDTHHFDVILLDLSLPDSYGLDTFYTLCKKAPNIPIILLTGINSEQLATEAMQQGAQDYLVKGDVDTHSLVRAIRYAIERQRLVAELSQKANELQASNAELDAFAHTVAHQIKGLLSQIIGYTDFVRMDLIPEDTPQLYDILTRVLNSGEKMNKIIDELLFLSSIRSDADILITPLNMQTIILAAQERLATEITDTQTQIKSLTTWPEAQGYEPWIEEVWVNYLSNAIKYGGHPPHIELGATMQEDNMIRFWIKDNGNGISKENQQQLFQPHIRLNWQRLKGEGVGLSIVRRIIERCGGEVGVESSNDNGSLFWFTLAQVNDDAN